MAFPKSPATSIALPTEAEWTYACRAGRAMARWRRVSLKDVAWYSANADDKTHPVAKMKPNAWGLFDTLGNVAEWAVPGGTAVGRGLRRIVSRMTRKT